MNLGDSASFLGFIHQGTLDVNSQTVTLNSDSFALLGPPTNLAGGKLHTTDGVALGVGDNLVGVVNVDAKTAAGIGSTIAAIGGSLTLGDASSLAGFVSDGELRVGDNNFTLADSNEAVLGSLTTLGNGGLPGMFVAANGAVVEFDKNIIGLGTVDSPNDPARPRGVVSAQMIYLFDDQLTTGSRRTQRDLPSLARARPGHWSMR